MSEKPSSSSVSSEEDDNVLKPEVLEKYKAAARISQDALTRVVQACIVGKSVVELADIGDRTIEEMTSAIYNVEKDEEPIEKGVAFPTCISINECVGNYSPEAEDTRKIAEGDVVKIDLGCHIDGYTACASHTVIVSSSPVTDARADATEAAWVAADAVAKSLVPGTKTIAISAIIKKIAAAYGVFPVDGVLSHCMKRFVIDGNKTIPNLLSASNIPMDPNAEVELDDVFCIDVVMSTKEPKTNKRGQIIPEVEGEPIPPPAAPKELGDKFRPTVYKRNVEEQFMLRLKTSRQLMSEIQKKHATFPFSIRSLRTKLPRIGIKEMIEHNMLSTYPPMFLKPGTFVAQVKLTCIVTEKGVQVLCGGAASASILSAAHHSEKAITDPEILSILQKPLTVGSAPSAKKNKKKNKKKKSAEKSQEEDKKKKEDNSKAESK
ncbi:putative proliferation-associated protein 1 [Monocercomonoides exilis]|uniref:putative proliferation-associated protein 1 n=1 Tax=Monocercomonoides exilis TaxID=2049356 RepID=UPI00355A9403|nr:putative proliferation-associated protein 1 [Monocercomonoides exilis]|eukprot:MONOS_13998.1-p1 / transcript=MONOS_13998.1 / gene=MONOS_13998 / organism=Monocercomonoides_exilis_PA203 / gene_product=proliferation-associated protein 1 / transcript_product=proliferation-associated protein 1 / location=Mono_scaffold00919:2700-4314(-) / protein_length=434 / sequence_SO=supercontig / SO=protein_coding / is_pseudo=false